MDLSILKTLGEIAGIGGLALGVVLLVFRDIIRRNIFSQLSKEQGFRLLRLISVLVWSIALGGLLAWVMVTMRHTSTPSTQQVKMPSLALTILKNGWLNVLEKGRVFEFALSNPTDSVAIVESVSIDVLDSIKDDAPDQEGVLPEFNYKLTIDPAFRGEKTFATGLKYGSGEADKFSIIITSDQEGWDYFFRLVVVWHNPMTLERKKLYSKILVARFPSLNPVERTGTEESKRRHSIQNELVFKRLEELEKALTKNQTAL